MGRALVLNASLKHAPEASNTQELAELVLEHLRPHRVTADVVRLADLRLPVGLGYRESDDDEWPAIVAKLKAADIVLFATPIWWGGRSSLMQRVIERMEDYDTTFAGRANSYIVHEQLVISSRRGI